MSDTAIAMMAGAVTLIGAMVTAAVTILKLRDKIQERRDDSALGPLRDALDLRAKDCERLSIQVSSLSKSVEQLLAENADCYVDMSHLYGWAEQASHALARHLGKEVDKEIGPLPVRKERPRRAEFDARSAQQAAILVQASSTGHLPPAQ